MNRRFRKKAGKRSAVPAITFPLLSLACLGVMALPAQAQQATTPVQQDKPAPKDQPPPAPAPGVPIISQIEVRKNKTLNEFFIVNLSQHKVGDPATNEVLIDMQTNLIRSGYFGANSNDITEAVRVYTIEDNRMPDRRQVIIEVDENPTIKVLQIQGSGPVKESEVRELLHIKENQTVYNPVQLGRDAQDVQDLYNKKGYIVTLGNDTDFDQNNPGVYRFSLVVTRVSEIKLNKVTKTKPRVIYREMRTKVGDYYNRITFESDLKRLFNLDLFEDIKPAEQIVSDGKVSLTLNLPEKRTGIVSAGVGFSNRAQLIGRAEITETNFRGRGQTVNLLWQAGGAVSRNSVELGFTEPWLDNRHTLMNVQLYDKTVFRFSNTLGNSVVGSTTNVGTDNRYNEQRTGGTLTFSRPLKETYRAALTLRGENVRTDRLALTAFNSQIIQNGPLVSLGGSLVHDSRDIALDPVVGNFQSYSLEVGGASLRPVDPSVSVADPSVFGRHVFSKLMIDSRNYFSLQGPRRRNKFDEDKSVIAVRFQGGASLGTLPFFEQFFLGGAESLRGYREDRFWGNKMFLGSVELRQPITKGFKGVLFLDAGSAWGGSFRDVQIQGFNQTGFQLNIGVGLGVRVRTPIGPLRLDFGFGREGGRTHFSFANTF